MKAVKIFWIQIFRRMLDKFVTYNRVEEQKQLAVLEERERLAREIHDNIGPALSYLQTQTAVVREYLAKSDIQQADEQMQRISQVAAETNLKIREYLTYLKTTTTGALFIQLEEHLRKFSVLYDYEVTLPTVYRPKLPFLNPEIGLEIFRISQEALNNIGKHADARQIKIHIQQEQSLLLVMIQDDGKGFLQSTTETEKGYGLSIMRERAANIGGKLTVQSAPGEGTQVRLEVSLPVPLNVPIVYFNVILKRKLS